MAQQRSPSPHSKAHHSGAPPVTRRRFLRATAAACTAPLFIPSTAFGANDRIHMAAIGVGNRGRDDMRGLLRFPQVQMSWFSGKWSAATF